MALLRRTAFSAALGLFATASAARADKSGTRPTAISVPRGPGSIEGLGEAFEVNLNSGSAKETVALRLPPGTNGFAPKLALTYDSGSGNGPVGVGWSLGVSTIQCETEKGLPQYLGDDPLLYEGAEIVPLGGGVYRLKNEWQYVRIRQSGPGFEVDLPSGVVRRYGIDSADSQIASNGQVFAWYLEAEVDLFGNEVRYTYTKDQGVPYLTSVQYDVVPGAAQNEVDFAYAPRPDVLVDDRPTFSIHTAQRLTDIRVFADGSLVRHYALAYAPASALSVLASITMTGEDDQTALPPLQFTYSQPSLATQPILSLSQGPPVLPGSSPDVELADMDGDGFPDILVGQQSAQGWYRNQGGTSFGSEQLMNPSPSVALGNAGVDLADMNADGLADLVVQDPGGANFRYFPGNGTGTWGAPVYFSGTPSFTVGDPELRLVDLDHDHLPDAFLLSPTTAAWWRNNGDGSWSAQQSVPLPSGGPTLDFADTRVKLVDMNGDGLLDLVYVSSGLVVYWPSLGRGTFDTPVVMSGAPNVGTAVETQLQVADLNGDGLADLFFVDTSQVDIWIAQPGDAYGPELTVQNTPYADASLTQVRTGDMNGNGSIDIVWFTPTNAPDQRVQYVDVLDGLRPNLLIGVQNGLGLTRAITYSNSGDAYEAAVEAGTPWTTRLPFPVQVVEDSQLGDSNGGNYLTTYQYANGYYDPGNREFRGFANAQEVQLGESADPTSVTLHTYDLGLTAETLKGHELETEVEGADGTVFSDAQLTWETPSYATGTDGRQVVGALKIQDDDYLYEGTATPAHVQEAWTYDDYGNALTDSKYGRIVNGQPTAADETLITRQIANDPNGWILGRVYDEVTTDAAGNQAAETRTYYDGAPFMGLPLGQIQNGVPTRVEKWASGTSFVSVDRRQYDAFGNVVETLSPLGASHQFSYDAQTHTFPVLETVATDADGGSLQFSATYDGATGLVSSYTDDDGAVSQFAYDPLERLVGVARVGDTLQLPTLAYVYTLGDPVSSVETVTRQTVAGTATAASFNYYDGLGRELGVVTQAEGGQWAVSDRKTYSQRGAVLQEFDAYFQGDSTLDPVPSDVPVTAYTYDVPGRHLQSTFPDGKITQTRYYPLLKEHWDAEDLDPSSPHYGTPLRQQLDGQQRIIQVQELLGQDTLVTNFGYDPLGRRVSVTNASGAVTSYAYDGLGRLLQLVHPDAGKRLFSWDDDGNCTLSSDALGQQIQRTYDAADRVLTEAYVDANGGAQGQVTYHYDAPSPKLSPKAPSTGRLSWVQDLAGEEHFAYDARGRQIDDLRVVSVGGADAGSYLTQEAYDDQDEVTSITYPDGTAVQTLYGPRGLLSSIPGVVDGVTYGANALPIQRSYSNGVTTQVGYDVHDRVISLSSTGPGGTALQGLGYTYDGAANVLAISDSVHPTGNLSSAWSFQVDDLYRLTSGSGPALPGGTSLSQQYDPVGNLLQKSDMGAYAYPTGGQPDAVQSVGANAFTTDANGSITASLGRTFAYDPKGELTQVVASGTTVTSTYGYMGQRVIKQISGAAGTHSVIYLDKFSQIRDGQLVKYVFAGDQRLAQIGGPAPSQTPNALSLASPPPRAPFFALALALGAGLVVSRRRRPAARGGRPRWLHRAIALLLCLSFTSCSGCGSSAPHAIASVYYLSDRQEGPTVLTDAAGKLLGQSNDDPWGKQLVSDSDPYGFAGQEWDAEAGLYDFGARYYDPQVGRFLTVDPAVLDDPSVGVTDPQSLNAYAYARNDPNSVRDQGGHLPQVLIGAGVGGLVGLGIYTASALYNHQQLTWRGALGATANGAITGAVASATFGLSLVGQASWIAAGGVYGGMVNRAIVTGSPKQTYSPTAMLQDGEASLLTFGVNKSAGAAGRKILGALADRFGAAGEAAAADTAGDAKPALQNGGSGQSRPRLVIGKMSALQAPGALEPGEVTLPGMGVFKPNLGSPAANWARNAQLLRVMMSFGEPIRDASSALDAQGRFVVNSGFLKAERALLQDRGWTFDASSSYWNPPMAPSAPAPSQ